MHPDATGKAYDELTHLWTRADFDRGNGIEAHRRAIAFTDRRGRALDVGCGCTGRFIELLQTEGFAPEGIDVSAQMVVLARQRHPQVPIHHGDICGWELQQRYDFITAWDSIWHVPLSEQEKVLRKLVASLNSGGVLLFSFGGTNARSEHTDDFMGPEVYYSSLGTNGFIALLIDLGCICRHLEYDGYPELHAYLIAQKIAAPP
jgi:2-polyprenyl-3-methyl-5-hydroxy-6-metoxy-1,4-benzoquinol methylase